MSNKQPHKHAEAIKAWADGAMIQCRIGDNSTWGVVSCSPSWDEHLQYRVKPEKVFPKTSLTGDDLRGVYNENNGTLGECLAVIANAVLKHFIISGDMKKYIEHEENK